MSQDLKDVMAELDAMRGLIEILAALSPDTRARVLAWLQSVTATAPGSASAPPTSAPFPPKDLRSAASERLSARIAQLSQPQVPEGPETPATTDGEAASAPRASSSLWRGKHA
jgi:hypothetical protein